MNLEHKFVAIQPMEHQFQIKAHICCEINSVDKFISGTISLSGEVNFIVECNIEIFKPIKDTIYTGIGC